MSLPMAATRDLYYTPEGEWIEFQGSVAYIGVSKFRLAEFEEIQEIILHEPSGFKQRGDLIATIKNKEFVIEMHMPTSGKIVQINEKYQSGELDIMIHDSENSGWVALIVPSDLVEQNHLLIPLQYQEKI